MRCQSPEEGSSDSSEDDSNPSSSGIRREVVNRSLDHLTDSNDTVLVGVKTNDVDTAALHPTQPQIFRLWQIYLDNVDPLLKVTHAPSLQPRFINAAVDVSNIEPTLDALMFSIYAVAILSLEDEEHRSTFGYSKDEALKSYQAGCRTALIKARMLRTDSRECLTALYLYLVRPLCKYLRYVR